jgi:hypothetical protein
VTDGIGSKQVFQMSFSGRFTSFKNLKFGKLLKKVRNDHNFDKLLARKPQILSFYYWDALYMTPSSKF